MMSTFRSSLLAGLLLVMSAGAQQSSPLPERWKAVESAFGRSGELQPDGVLKFSLPRRDLKVSVQGVEIRPALALGSWVAFHQAGQHAMVMGDLVLAEGEVASVARKLSEGGIEITGLHNHLVGERPAVMYMHIGGTGDPVRLARAIRAAVELTKTPPPDAAGAGEEPKTPTLDTARIEHVLGHQGRSRGGVFQVNVPRAQSPRHGALDIPNSMGTTTVLNFQPLGSGRAAITGDFVLEAQEVNPVIAALREHGIDITALHSHMLNEEPRLFFMHFWAQDDALKLARGLRAALDRTASKKSN